MSENPRGIFLTHTVGLYSARRHTYDFFLHSALSAIEIYYSHAVFDSVSLPSVCIRGKEQESPADARVTRDTAATYRTLNSAIRSADPENSGLEISNM